MIRPITKQDIPAIKNIIDSTELFPSEMLDDMVQGHLDNPETSSEVWLTEVDEKDNDTPISVVYAVPEKMTVGTYNALVAAVSKNVQGKGHGSKLMKHLENELKATKEARILLVETSGTDDFKQTRSFYEKNGYEKEARIRDYFEPGDDKIVYRKDLNVGGGK
eukprot:CAMPEP_0119551770 /NCGR_PEP_ID=MMETSP1352-20130426/4936_1 /TAXON_ID=265584 /ORGANISM="Stauroneis constricta, Strain CCMP1120" /LENGTH=162 /DNA_ID=CAMNT_0007597885 /DNA_START=162 /DNA_END=651 /DNA_ORIENTATION=-